MLRGDIIDANHGDVTLADDANHINNEVAFMPLKEVNQTEYIPVSDEENLTTHVRRKTSDAREMQTFYGQYYEKYIQALDKAADKVRAQLTKAYQTAVVLFEGLKEVNRAEYIPVSDEIMEALRLIEEMKQSYAPYNILPLDPNTGKEAIMRYHEHQLLSH
ncbi:Callose synthase 2 [Glycine max]|nr:Callose synthase 2 [Glycine max]